MNTLPKLIACLALLLLMATPGQARTVAWFSGIGDNFLKDDGVTPLDVPDTANPNSDPNFRFELGGFASGFTPTLANLSLWESNWVAFDSAFYDDGLNNGGWNPTPGISNYTSSASTVAAGAGLVTSSDTGNTFSVGQQAYLWTFNSKTISPTTEWALITNSAWLFPASDPLNPNALEWTLGDAGNAAVVGEVSNSGSPDFISTLQTQTVPEPGSALLIAMAGILLRLRRRLRH